jgi:hypothetical protein
MKHFLLFYDAGPDYAEKRAPHRPAHLAHARAAAARGELVLGGALTDPIDMSVLLFKAQSAEVARAFAEADPYVVHGVVLGWRVREWTTVVGEGALTQLP